MTIPGVILLALVAALTAAGSSFTLTSAAFTPGSSIPKKYTCDGGLQPVSPPLHWTAGPSGTRAFAIEMVDTDAHFRHWIGWGISSSARGLRAGQHPPHEGSNDLLQTRYDGPCPQGSGTHHYRFRVYALDKNVAPSLVGVVPKTHVLAAASLVGTYKKK